MSDSLKETSDSLIRSFLVSEMSDSLIFGERPERESVRGGADLPLNPHAPPPEQASLGMGWGGGGQVESMSAPPLTLTPSLTSILPQSC